MAREYVMIGLEEHQTPPMQHTACAGSHTAGGAFPSLPPGFGGPQRHHAPSWNGGRAHPYSRGPAAAACLTPGDVHAPGMPHQQPRSSLPPARHARQQQHHRLQQLVLPPGIACGLDRSTSSQQPSASSSKSAASALPDPVHDSLAVVAAAGKPPAQQAAAALPAPLAVAPAVLRRSPTSAGLPAAADSSTSAQADTTAGSELPPTGSSSAAPFAAAEPAGEAEGIPDEAPFATQAAPAQTSAEALRALQLPVPSVPPEYDFSPETSSSGSDSDGEPTADRHCSRRRRRLHPARPSPGGDSTALLWALDEALFSVVRVAAALGFPRSQWNAVQRAVENAATAGGASARTSARTFLERRVPQLVHAAAAGDEGVARCWLKGMVERGQRQSEADADRWRRVCSGDLGLPLKPGAAAAAGVQGSGEGGTTAAAAGGSEAESQPAPQRLPLPPPIPTPHATPELFAALRLLRPIAGPTDAVAIEALRALRLRKIPPPPVLPLQQQQQPADNQQGGLLSGARHTDGAALARGVWLAAGEVMRAAAALGVCKERVFGEQHAGQQADEAVWTAVRDAVEDLSGGSREAGRAFLERRYPALVAAAAEGDVAGARCMLRTILEDACLRMGGDGCEFQRGEGRPVTPVLLIQQGSGGAADSPVAGEKLGGSASGADDPAAWEDSAMLTDDEEEGCGHAAADRDREQQQRPLQPAAAAGGGGATGTAGVEQGAAGRRADRGLEASFAKGRAWDQWTEPPAVGWGAHPWAAGPPRFSSAWDRNLRDQYAKAAHRRRHSERWRQEPRGAAQRGHRFCD